MKTYVVTNSSNTSSDSYILVNGAETIELKRRTIIEKIRNNEIKLLNKEVRKIGRKNDLVDIPYNGVLSEQILFDIYLASVIKSNQFSDDFLFVVLAKIKSLFYRSGNLVENKDLFLHCVGILRRFFNYMGRTKVNVPLVKEDVGIVFRDNKKDASKREKVYQECKSLFDINLSTYRTLNNRNSDIEQWYQGENNIFLYRCFLSILESVYSKKDRPESVGEFEAVYSILTLFFKNVDFTFLGGYLFSAYSKSLFEAILVEIEKNDISFFVFQDISPDVRAIKAREAISVTNKELEKYNNNLKRISNSYESLVCRYQKPVLDLLSNLNTYSFDVVKNEKEPKDFSGLFGNSTNNPIGVDTNKLYSVYLDKSTQKTCALIYAFNKFIEKNKAIKNYDNLSKLLDYSCKIGEATDISILNYAGMGGKAALEVKKEVEKEIKSSREKYLGPYSKSFINNFSKYRKYEIDILSYLLDIRSYYLLQEDKRKLVSFRKSENWQPIYCVRELKPMAIISCEDFNNPKSHLGHITYQGIREGIEISWLTSYYFYNSYVKRNSALEMDKDVLFLKTVSDLLKEVHFKGKDRIINQLDSGILNGLANRVIDAPFYWKLRVDSNVDVRDMLKEVED